MTYPVLNMISNVGPVAVPLGLMAVFVILMIILFLTPVESPPESGDEDEWTFP